MGNFAENLNLGNRFRPPLVSVQIWTCALYTEWRLIDKMMQAALGVKGAPSYFFQNFVYVSFEESSLHRCKFKISVETVKLFRCTKQFSILHC